jgi:hypothetical protein
MGYDFHPLQGDLQKEATSNSTLGPRGKKLPFFLECEKNLDFIVLVVLWFELEKNLEFKSVFQYPWSCHTYIMQHLVCGYCTVNSV